VHTHLNRSGPAPQGNADRIGSSRPGVRGRNGIQRVRDARIACRSPKIVFRCPAKERHARNSLSNAVSLSRVKPKQQKTSLDAIHSSG